MLGHAMICILSENKNLKVYGSIRSKKVKKFFSKNISKHLVECKDLTKYDNLLNIFNKVKPNILINCISLNKKFLIKLDPLMMISIYSLLPHQLAKICGINNARLIHISTDGIFSGSKGGYVESDKLDVHDLYGVAKYIGEVNNKSSITIRTSIIGHELEKKWVT